MKYITIKHFFNVFLFIEKQGMKFIYSWMLCCLSLLLMSQERKIIEGKVYINDLQEPVSGIYVKNQTSQYTTITDIVGNFSLPARLGDVILFQSYNVQSRTITITPLMYKNQVMSIHLDAKEREIAEVYITPFKTYGSIELDVKRIPMMNKTNEILAKLGSLTPSQKLDGSTDVDSESAKLSSMKMSIDGVLDLLSGDNKRRERLQAYEAQIKIIRNIREYFGDEYFIGIGLEKHEIDEFILYTYLNHDVKFFYEHNNYFQILNVFDKNVLAYKARKQQPAPTSPKVGETYFKN